VKCTLGGERKELESFSRADTNYNKYFFITSFSHIENSLAAAFVFNNADESLCPFFAQRYHLPMKSYFRSILKLT